MAESAENSFVVECPDCTVIHSSGNFKQTSDFVNKHEEHTGHEMEWVNAKFDIEIEQETNWTVYCDECEENREFPSEEEASKFRREHAKYTDHGTPEAPEKNVLDIPDIPLDDRKALKDLIDRLADKYDEGAPEQALYAQFVGTGANEVADVKHELEQLKQRGEVYEPRSGYLRTT